MTFIYRAMQSSHLLVKTAGARKAAREHWRQLFPELGRQLSINVDHIAIESSLSESQLEVRISTEPTARNRRWDDVKDKPASSLNEEVAAPDKSPVIELAD